MRIARLSDAERRGGVVAASAGNHAQGVALAAPLLGAHATVFMPEGAPIPKVEATRAYGAEIRIAGTTIDEALRRRDGARRADRRGADPSRSTTRTSLPGQGTVGLEILEQCPDVRPSWSASAAAG